MKALTTIKTTGLRSLAIHDGAGELIATASKMLKRDEDSALGMYRICIYSGQTHGKLAYAQDLQDLNDKSVELLALR